MSNTAKRMVAVGRRMSDIKTEMRALRAHPIPSAGDRPVSAHDECGRLVRACGNMVVAYEPILLVGYRYEQKEAQR